MSHAPCPNNTLLSIFLGALFIVALCAWTPGHERWPMSEQEEAALLDQLVAQSPHRLALEAAKAVVGDGPVVGVPAANPLAPPPPPPKAWPAKKGRRVYGFLPYWIGAGNVLHWGELTQIAYFSAELNSKGQFGSVHGWGGSTAKKLIAQAHQHGVQVPLTVTLFSKSGIGAVLSTAAKRTALVKTISNLVISGGGDGVNIDFEGLQLADRDEMKAFITELNTTMKKKLPGADVTLATPAVDWAGAWDYDYLAEHSDGLFVMAYGLHWKGSDPGPQLPMAVKAPWKHKTLPWVVDDYYKWGKSKNKHKFIIGLPLYGNRWPSASNKVGAKKLANGKAVTMESAWAAAAGKGGWKYDPASKSAWYAWIDSGKWMQAWVETPQTFAYRTEYLDLRDVQLGLWALGYADKMNKVWQAIADYQDAGTTPGTGSDAGPTDASGLDAGGKPDKPPPQDIAGKDTAKDIEAPDTGAPDTAAEDLAEPDTAAPDTAAPDTAAPDTASSDTASPDAGAPEADVQRPAPDLGQDSGEARPPLDAGSDLGRPVGADVGATPPAMQAAASPGSGCGASPGSSAPLACLMLLGITLLGLRRRVLR